MKSYCVFPRNSTFSDVLLVVDISYSGSIYSMESGKHSDQGSPPH